MKAIKRTVAALLATLMLATSTSFTLAAEEYSDAEAVVVAKVNAAGIMTGTDKGFEPSKSLTRAEAAAIIVRMKGISETAVKSMAGTTLFNDVAASHWASGYVNEASQLGIVKGVSATEFAPDREVTVAEFVTMAVRALGAGTMVDTQGAWPTNYVNFANEEGLLNNVSAIYTAVATRLNAAAIVANALEAPMWVKDKVTTNNEVTWTKHDDKNILSDTLNIGLIKEVVFTSINTKDFEVDFETIALDESDDPLYSWSKEEVADSVELATVKQGVVYDVWYNTKSNKVVGIWKAEDYKQNVVKFTDIVKIDSSKGEITLTVDGNEEKYKYVDNTTPAYVNGDKVADKIKSGTAPFIAAGNEDAFGSVVLNGNTIKTMYVEYYQAAALIKEVKNDTIFFNDDLVVGTAYETTDTSIEFDEDDYEYSITKDGKEIKFEDIEEDDLIFYYVIDDEDTASRLTKYVIDVRTNAVEGKVTAYKEGSYIKVDGTKYEIVAGIDIDTDIEIKAYLNAAGKIAAYEVVDEDNDSDLAVVTSFRKATDKYGKASYEVELTSFDGKAMDVKTLNMDEMKEKFTSFNIATMYDAAVEELTSNYAAGVPMSIVGELVRYEIKDDKYVITEYVDIDDKLDSDNVKSNETKASKKLAVLEDATYNEDTMKINGNIKVTDDTKIILVKAKDNTKSKAAYSVDVEVIKAEDLGATTAANTYDMFVSGLNESTNKVSNIVIYLSDAKRASDKLYAVLLNKDTLTNDDDYNYEVEMLLTDGSVETYKSKDDIDTGVVFEIKVSGEELTDATAISDTATAKIFSISDGIAKASNSDDSTSYYQLAEQFVYVVNDDDDLSKGTSSKVKTLAKSEKYSTSTAATEVTLYFAENTDTDEDEIIAIFYNK